MDLNTAANADAGRDSWPYLHPSTTLRTGCIAPPIAAFDMIPCARA